MSTGPTMRFEAASTLAVVMSSHEPLLFLTQDLRIIAASASFCDAFGIDPSTVYGKRVGELGEGEWAMPTLVSLLTAAASGNERIESYEIDLRRPGHGQRNLVVNARALDDGDTDNVRLLLAVNDVTDIRNETRVKDKLVLDNSILMQEVQHRVANSLQIIASVLMQSARRVQSEEARGYLQSAHHRVMSIAALQRQLSVSGTGTVSLRSYLNQLAQSLGASMIPDPERIAIRVDVDSSTVDAGVSVSLGLIVTELVINSLKHAFPDEQGGEIRIDYHASGEDWTLSVVDNGIGMPTGADAPKAGLGTGIVEALVNNLDASLTYSDAGPGTAATIVHRSNDEADSSD